MEVERGDLEQNLIPIYKFEWEDGFERRTDELEEQHPTAVENLAEIGRRDDECEVTLVEYTT